MGFVATTIITKDAVEEILSRVTVGGTVTFMFSTGLNRRFVLRADGWHQFWNGREVTDITESSADLVRWNAELNVADELAAEWTDVDGDADEEDEDRWH